MLAVSGCGGSGAQSPGSGGAGGAGTGGAGAAGSGGSVGGIGGGGGSAAQTCVPPSAIDQPPAKLSQTGCMSPTDVKLMAASVIPYEVNSALWSDGADKQRGLALPSGRKIHVKNCAAAPDECPQGAADDGKWVLPVGTVMVKSFLFDGKLVETRLFVRFDAATWVGYGYRWDEAQTDGTIVPDERVEIMFDTGARSVAWRYPSRLDCMTCHVATGGSTLGPETAQLNRIVNGTNQLDRFGMMGLFDASLATPYKAALPDPLSAQGATVEQRARSYLHANCGFCHRPNDEVFPDVDLRGGVAVKDMNICGVTPARGDQGVPGALVVSPGQPARSVMSLRMQAPPDDAQGKHGRMPKIASYVVDTAAVSLIDSWITSLTSCPQ